MEKRVNSKFFTDRMRYVKVSQNQLGEMLNMNKAVVSKTIRGMRPVRIEEVVEIAKILKVTQNEVLEAFGHTASDFDTSIFSLPIIGAADSNGLLSTDYPKTIIPRSSHTDKAAVLSLADDHTYGWAYLLGAPQEMPVYGILAVFTFSDGSSRLSIGKPGFTCHEVRIGDMEYIVKEFYPVNNIQCRRS